MTLEAEKSRVTLRAARSGEEGELGRRGYESFRIGDVDGWTRYYQENTHVRLEDTLVAEAGGVPLGQASALALTFRFSGTDLAAPGIAAVGVLPEGRRRGVADALVRELLRRMRRRGDALTFLYPFHARYYRKFGFGRVEWIDCVRVSPRELPASPLRRRVRALDRERDFPALRRVYERWRQPLTGPLARSDYWWRVRVLERAPQGVGYEDERGQLSGYLLYEHPAGDSLGEQSIFVKELAATTPDASRGLLGFLEAQGEQCRTIDLALPLGEARALLTGADRPETAHSFRFHQVEGVSAAGMMARIVDVEAALALHPRVARSGVRATVGLDIEDPLFARPSRFDVRLGPRGASATPGTRARKRLSLTIDRLAQIYFAAVPARVLLRHGQISGSETAAQALDAGFAGPPPFVSPLNGF